MTLLASVSKLLNIRRLKKKSNMLQDKRIDLSWFYSAEVHTIGSSSEPFYGRARGSIPSDDSSNSNGARTRRLRRQQRRHPFERPVRTGAFLAPVRTGRLNGPFERVVCIGLQSSRSDSTRRASRRVESDIHV